jgi:predicted transcriptional regulator
MIPLAVPKTLTTDRRCSSPCLRKLPDKSNPSAETNSTPFMDGPVEDLRMQQMDASDSTRLSELTAEIVGAFVSSNSVHPDELTSLIADVHAALVRAPSVGAMPEPQEPAVPVRISVKPDYVVCLEDGKKFKSLKRHLANEHGMTPAEYRTKWGLRSDYPMVAPNYAQSRSELAKAMGLGKPRANATVQNTPSRPNRKATSRPKSARRSKTKAASAG